MKSSRCLTADFASLRGAALGTGLLLATALGLVAEEPPLLKQLVFDAASAGSGAQSASPQSAASVCNPATLGSPYVPVDSWIYPEMFRLYGLGFLDRTFLGMRPWTRGSISHMLEDVGAKIQDADQGPVTDEAQEI